MEGEEDMTGNRKRFLQPDRLIFLLLEAVRRKPLPRKVEGYIHMAGLALLLLLMVAVTFKDIFGLFS